MKLMLMMLMMLMDDMISYERFLYKMEEGNDELDIFYLFFGILRQILWDVSPNLRDVMLEE